MKVGIHLPQYGRISGPDAISTAARDAEELGFADVWVSDHIVGTPHPRRRRGLVGSRICRGRS